MELRKAHGSREIYFPLNDDSRSSTRIKGTGSDVKLLLKTFYKFGDRPKIKNACAIYHRHS